MTLPHAMIFEEIKRSQRAADEDQSLISTPVSASISASLNNPTG